MSVRRPWTCVATHWSLRRIDSGDRPDRAITRRDGRSNAPHISLYPNVRGVILAEVRLSCDVRHSDHAEMLAMEQELREACAKAASERGVEISPSSTSRSAPSNLILA